MRTRILTFGIIIVAVAALVAVAATQLRGQTAQTYGADVIGALADTNTAGYARAFDVREFTFPRDFGAHPDYQTEWWYYTGNLATDAGRRFGYQLTIFRRSLAPTAAERASAWGTNQLYFAHFTVSDIQSNKFYEADRYARGAAGLAGATTEPQVRVWIEDWEMLAQDASAGTMRLTAADKKGFAIDLTVRQSKPPTLQGDRGLSAKSPESGNASYYYSLSRLETQGTITLNGQPVVVRGASWKDHEYSTSGLSKEATGWDWFSLQLDDNRELMLYRIRRTDGTYETTSDGTLINADGSYEHLVLSQYKIEELARWSSPHSNGVYPAKWRVTVTPKQGDPIILNIEPLMSDQEVNATGVYWEGASRISGTQGAQTLTGYGYVELTGYARRADDLPTR